MTLSPDAPLVLVVEDEDKLADLISDYLSAAQFRVKHLSNGLDVVPFARTTPPDLILLDVMLPGLDGMEVCRKLREFSEVPIIMITARVEEIDRLLGFGLGADDYICKPFSPREVVARAKALLKRAQRATTTESQNIEPFRIDRNGMRIWLGDTELDLTPTEYRLLEVFIAQPGRVFSRQQLLDKLHDVSYHVVMRTIDTHIKNIRKKMSKIEPEQQMMRSVYGVGYKLEIP